MMNTARAKVQAEAAQEQDDATNAAHPSLRTLPLGQDRDGRLFWKIQTSAVLTGWLCRNAATCHLRMHTRSYTTLTASFALPPIHGGQ